MLFPFYGSSYCEAYNPERLFGLHKELNSRRSMWDTLHLIRDQFEKVGQNVLPKNKKVVFEQYTVMNRNPV